MTVPGWCLRQDIKDQSPAQNRMPSTGHQIKGIAQATSHVGPDSGGRQERNSAGLLTSSPEISS